jgi:ParB family chromosome partitioning protein
MSAADKTAEKLHELKHIPIKQVSATPSNPRLVFPPDELDQLSQSISIKGVLVPIVVAKNAKKKNEFVLVDGERRFRCARDLGHETIPAVITDPQNPESTLLDMFNIHMVREPWKEMPTAWALSKLIAARGQRREGTTDAELASVTGLTTDQLKRLRHALELPKLWQDYIHEGKIPLNFFWELRVNVIEPLAKHRPGLMGELGKDRVQRAFVAKRLADVITDVVSLRRVREIVMAAARDAGEATEPSVLDETLRQLVKDKTFSVEEAYEESVEVLVELDRLERKCDNMVKAIERLLERTVGSERKKVKLIGKSLIERLSEVVS